MDCSCVIRKKYKRAYITDICDYHNKFRCSWIYPTKRKCMNPIYNKEKYCYRHINNNGKCKNLALINDIYCKYHLTKTFTQQKLKII